jgi:hypothetical protein
MRKYLTIFQFMKHENEPFFLTFQLHTHPAFD